MCIHLLIIFSLSFVVDRTFEQEVVERTNLPTSLILFKMSFALKLAFAPT
jgi:hypothetical protein